MFSFENPSFYQSSQCSFILHPHETNNLSCIFHIEPRSVTSRAIKRKPSTPWGLSFGSLVVLSSKTRYFPYPSHGRIGFIGEYINLMKQNLWLYAIGQKLYFCTACAVVHLLYKVHGSAFYGLFRGRSSGEGLFRLHLKVLLPWKTSRGRPRSAY